MKDFIDKLKERARTCDKMKLLYTKRSGRWTATFIKDGKQVSTQAKSPDRALAMAMVKYDMEDEWKPAKSIKSWKGRPQS